MADYYILSTKYSLAERQTKNNGKVYDAIFRVLTKDGKTTQKKLSGYKTKTLAKQAHDEFIVEKCELLKNNPWKTAHIKEETQKTEPLVYDVYHQYLASMQHQNKDSTIQDRASHLKLYVLPTFGNKKIRDITPEDIEAWQAWLWSYQRPGGTCFSYNYLCKIRDCFRSFMTYATRRQKLLNPFEGIKRPKRKTLKKQMDFWTLADFKRFIAAVDDPTYHCLFTLLFFTGRRRGEILALTPADVAKKGYIHFNKSVTYKTLDGSSYKITTTKANKESIVPVCSVVQNELKAYGANGPFLLGGDRPLPQETVRRKFKQYTEASGVKPIRIHDLRHSFVSLLIHNGANLTVVANLIDDALEQVTRTYAHMYDGDEKTVLSRIKSY